MKSRKRPQPFRRSIRIDGHKTSVVLEDEFWEALKEIATERGMAVGNLIASIKADRREGNLSSAIRMFVLRHYQDRISAIQTPST